MADNELRVAFYDPDTMTARPLSGGNTYLLAENARGKGYTSKIGNGEVKIPITELSKVTDPAYTFIQQNDICTVWWWDGTNKERITSFVIRSVKMQPPTSYGNAGYFTLSGPDMLFYLGKVLNYNNIGKEYSSTRVGASVTTNNFIYVGHGDLLIEGHTNAGWSNPDEYVFWPKWTLIKRSSREQGKGSVGFSNSVESIKSAGEQWAEGDDMHILWEFSPHNQDITSISSITLSNGGPDYNYNLIDTLTHNVPRKEGSGQERYYPCFKPHLFKGDPIEIQMSDTNWHKTRVLEAPRYNGFRVENAVTVNVAAGATLKWINAREINTVDDVAKIMAPATDWTVNGSVSSKGSAHIIEGGQASTFDLLEITAESVGDHFYASQAAGDTPEKTLEWKTSSPATGITLKVPTQAGMAAAIASATQMVVHSLVRESRHQAITRIVPVGGTNDDITAEWNIGMADESAAAGLLRIYGITTADAFVTEYNDGTWRIRNASTVIVREERQEFSDIVPKSNSAESLIEAANALQAAGALQLHLYRRTEHFYSINTVMPIGVEVNQGESITLDFDESEWDDGSITVYISELEHFVQNSGKLAGLRQTRMFLTRYGPLGRVTGATVVANAIRKGLKTGGTSIRGSGGIGGGVPDEGDVTPPQSEVTIASSTPTGSLTISDQALTLLITHGDGLVATGTDIDIDLGTNSGLTFSSNELVMGSPDDVGASTSNVVSGTGHSHNVLTTDDARANPGVILAPDSNGRFKADGIRLGNVGDAANDHLILDDIVDIYGDDYEAAGASGFTKSWYLDTENAKEEGTLYISNIVADSLIVQLFQAEMTIATTSGLIVTKSVGIVHETFILPSTGNSVGIIIKDNPVISTAGVFEDNDKVVFRAFKRDSGLTLGWAGGYVDGYSDNGDGTQDWTFHREDSSSGLDTLEIQQGTPIIDYGVSGQGWWEVDASEDTGPMTRIGTWGGANPWTPANRNIHTQTGRLLSLTGKEEYGFYAGVSINGPHAIISDTTAEFQDVSISMLEGTSDGVSIRIYALELNSSEEAGIAPNGDVSQDSVTRSTGTGTYYSHINEDPSSGQPDLQWLRNDSGVSASIVFDMEDISHTLTAMGLEAYITVGAFVDDTCQVRAQMFKSDGTTKLSDEIKVASESTADGKVNVQFTGLVSGTDGEWAAARLKLTWVYFVAGADEVITINADSGITIVVEDGYFDYKAYTFNDSSGNNIGGMYGLHHATDGDSVGIQVYSNTTDKAASVFASATADSGGSGFASIGAVGNDGVANIVTIRLKSSHDAGDDYVWIREANACITDGLLVGDSGAGGPFLTHEPVAGQIIIDQEAADGTALSLRSDDVTAMTTQGMDDNNTYFQISKASGDDGGAILRAASESVHGMWLVGSANTATTTLSAAGSGPVVLVGRVDNAAVGSGNNAIVLRSGPNTRWIMQGSGEVYMDGTNNESQWDDEDDVSLIRASMGKGLGVIQGKWDEFVSRNRQDLIDLGIVTDTGFVSQQKMMKLQNGAIWQLHQRIAELEGQIGNIHQRHISG